MDIPLSQRLSFKQASLTVLLALTLGGAFGLTRAVLDYASERDGINRKAQALLTVTTAAADHALREQDARLADQLVHGLLQAPAVLRAELRAADGTPLAIASRHPTESGWRRRLSDRLFGAELHLTLPLADGRGSQHLLLDTWPHGQRFLRRAGLGLAGGLTSSLLLSLALLGLSHLLLTRPLGSLVAALGSRDAQRSARTPLPCPAGHRHDEIGALVGAATSSWPASTARSPSAAPPRST